MVFALNVSHELSRPAGGVMSDPLDLITLVTVVHPTPWTHIIVHTTNGSSVSTTQR